MGRSRLANVVVVFIPVNRLKNINYTYKKSFYWILKRKLSTTHNKENRIEHTGYENIGTGPVTSGKTMLYNVHCTEDISRKEYPTFLEDQKIFSSAEIKWTNCKVVSEGLDRTRRRTFPDCTLAKETEPNQTKLCQTKPNPTKPDETMPNATEQKHLDRPMTLLQTNPARQRKNQRCWPPWGLLTPNQTEQKHTNQTKP